MLRGCWNKTSRPTCRTMWTLRVVTLAALAMAVLGQHNTHGVDAGGGWEWAGLFHLEQDWYEWTSQTTTSATNQFAYADAHMNMAVLVAANDSDVALDALKAQGSHLLNVTCGEVETGGVLAPSSSSCFELYFNPQTWQSVFKLNATGVEYVGIFTQHLPSEFERSGHYLKDDNGLDVFAEHTLPEVPRSFP